MAKASVDYPLNSFVRKPITRRAFMGGAAGLLVAGSGLCACSAQDVRLLFSSVSSRTESINLTGGISAAAENTEVLQNAIDDMSSAGGGVIYLSAGTYYFTWSNEHSAGHYAIYMRNGVHLVGSGMGETVLKPYGNYEVTGEAPHGIDMFYYDGLEDNTYLSDAHFRDFTVDGSSARGSREGYNASGKGFYFKLFRDCTWERVEVVETDGTGFGVDYPLNSQIINCVANACGKNATESSFGASGFGIGTGYCADESILISQCSAQGNTKFGYFFEHQSLFGEPKAAARKAAGFVVRNCSSSGNLVNFGGNRACDVRYDGCSSEEADFVHLERYNTYAFHFENHSRRITIQNSKSDQTYEDVSVSHSCYDALTWALARGVAEVGAEDNNLFRPGDAVLRAEFAEFLWRYAGRPGTVFFGWEVNLASLVSDVSSDAYYADAVLWLSVDNITRTPLFRPYDSLTYGELFIMLSRLCISLQDPSSQAAGAALSAGGSLSIPEGAESSFNEQEAYQWAKKLGITADIANSAELMEVCTRAEALRVLYAFDECRS